MPLTVPMRYSLCHPYFNGCLVPFSKFGNLLDMASFKTLFIKRIRHSMRKGLCPTNIATHACLVFSLLQMTTISPLQKYDDRKDCHWSCGEYVNSHLSVMFERPITGLTQVTTNCSNAVIPYFPCIYVQYILLSCKSFVFNILFIGYLSL